MQWATPFLSAHGSNLIILRDGNVLLDAKRPVDVEDVLVEGQHEHDQHKQRVEDGKEKDGLVAQLLQARGQFGLKTK